MLETRNLLEMTNPHLDEPLSSSFFILEYSIPLGRVDSRGRVPARFFVSTPPLHEVFTHLASPTWSRLGSHFSK